MIVEWIMSIGAAVAEWLITGLPAAEVNWVISADNLLAPFFAGAFSLGAWLPWGTLQVVMPIVFSTYVLSLFARALRAVIGHLPMIGGNG